MTPTSDIRCSN